MNFEDYFMKFAIPIISIFLIVFVKELSRKDRTNSSVSKEDYALGFDLAVTALVVFLVETYSKVKEVIKDVNYINVMPKLWVRSIMFFILFLVTLLWLVQFVKNYGWKNNGELKFGIGFVLPWLFGIISFSVVMILF